MNFLLNTRDTIVILAIFALHCEGHSFIAIETPLFANRDLIHSLPVITIDVVYF
jgi:hypothetical protein